MRVKFRDRVQVETPNPEATLIEEYRRLFLDRLKMIEAAMQRLEALRRNPADAPLPRLAPPFDLL